MPQAFLSGKAVAELVVGRDPATFVEAFRPSSRPLGPLGGDARVVFAYTLFHAQVSVVEENCTQNQVSQALH